MTVLATMLCSASVVLLLITAFKALAYWQPMLAASFLLLARYAMGVLKSDNLTWERPAVAFAFIGMCVLLNYRLAASEPKPFKQLKS
ncbi:MAG: hypothetical protein JNK63_04185 [Chthonomonas sp.]|nr:hypothetical protein [Chthonomonas sp.]